MGFTGDEYRNDGTARRRRLLIAAAVAAVVVAVAAMLLLPRSAPSETLDRLHIAVLPFVNPSGKVG